MTLKEWCEHNESRGNIILSEWTGLTDTGEQLNSLDDISHQSNKKLVWKCSNGHEWIATVQKRTLLHSDCPYCCNQKIQPGDNDLYTWCKNNNKEYLIEEWVGLDADNKEVDIHKVSKSTHKRVYWKHYKDGAEHRWIASISDRTIKNSRCPICYGRNNVKQGINDLETWCNEHPEFGDILNNQWLGKTESGKDIKMDAVSRGSKLKVAWRCSCGRIWYSTVLNRVTRKNRVCTICSRREAKSKRMETVLSSSITLLDWCRRNNLYGQILINEWLGIDEDEHSIKMSEVTYGSQKVIYWRHTTKEGKTHTWKASIHNRVFNHSMCPHCNSKGTSLPEQVIYRCFKQLFPDTMNREKFHGYELDVFIPELRTAIEYGSTYYHSGRENIDAEKEDICKRYGINLIKIIDDSNNELKHVTESNLIIDKFGSHAVLKEKLQFIFKALDIDFNIVDYDLALNESVKFMIN